MDDHHLIEQLVQRQESNDLDFKSKQYRLDNDHYKGQFIKDIVSMVNTPRDGSAYILTGVSEHQGKVTDIPGVDEHHDEATLGGIIGANVSPVPTFIYRQVQYQGKDIGLYEIPRNQPVPVPVLPTRNFGKPPNFRLAKDTVYFRRNTENTEADTHDINTITAWASSVGNPGGAQISGTPGGSWEQLYRYCGEFAPGQVNIAIFDRESGLDARDWSALAGIHWNAIIDLDAETDTAGNYNLGSPVFEENYSLHLAALESVPEITARSTVWIAAKGLKSRPSTEPVDSVRAWNRTKALNLEKIIDAMAASREPEPALVVVFSGAIDFVEKVFDILDRSFSDRAHYVFAAPAPALYSKMIDDFSADSVQIALAEVCQGLRERLPQIAKSEVSFPKLNGGTVEIPLERARWIEEHLELVHLGRGVDLDANIQSRRETAFLKGAVVSWEALDAGVDATRDITVQLEQQISSQLEARAARRIILRHWPGAGASTVSRRIVWDLHRQYPTVVALEIHSERTADRLRALFDFTQLPVLMLIDLPGVTQELVDRLYDILRSSNTPVVLFSVERHRLNQPGRSSGGAHYLDSRLSNGESYRLSSLLSGRVPDRKNVIEKLIDSDESKRTPFYFGLTAYGREFQGIEAYVKTRLAGALDDVKEAVLFAAFAYYYGQTALPIQTFSQKFGIHLSNLISYTKVFPDYIRELLLVEGDNKIRPAHYLIAEEILQQGLGPSNRRNWKNGLADVAVKFIDLHADLPHHAQGTISDTLRSVLIERDHRDADFSHGRGQFSQFLNDITSPDGRLRVLEHLTESFPEEPHFWAHLGRFYSFERQRHSEAHKAYQTAIGLSPGDASLHHMAGMGWRAELYDELDALSYREFSRENEENLFGLLNEATREFESGRRINRTDEHNYISQAQMILRFVGQSSSAAGYQTHETMKFLTFRGNDKYRELIDEAQNLLSDLELVKGNESKSELHLRVQAELKRLHGKHSEAVQGLTNLLDRGDVFKPPVRRAIIRARVDNRQGDWSQLSDRELARIVDLAESNVDEEPGSDHNLRLWLRAVRTENILSLDRIAERLAYKRLQNPSLDTAYYLYIMKFLQLEAGDLAARQDLTDLMKECGELALALSLQRTTTSLEWFGKESGLGSLVHYSTLGKWDEEENFFSNSASLRPVRGRIAEIRRRQGSGFIELTSGLRAFFVPSRGRAYGREDGGYVSGDINRPVEFFLGFSYDGLRAWSVHDAE